MNRFHAIVSRNIPPFEIVGAATPPGYYYVPFTTIARPVDYVSPPIESCTERVHDNRYAIVKKTFY
jgi:hypothetical protein